MGADRLPDLQKSPLLNIEHIRVLPRQQIRINGSDGGQGSPTLNHIQDALGLPGRYLVERIPGGMLEADQVDPVVAPLHVHQRRSGPVSSGNQLANKGGSLDGDPAISQMVQDQFLSGLQIQPDFNSNFCILVLQRLKILVHNLSPHGIPAPAGCPEQPDRSI